MMAAMASPNSAGPSAGLRALMAVTVCALLAAVAVAAAHAIPPARGRLRATPAAPPTTSASPPRRSTPAGGATTTVMRAGATTSDPGTTTSAVGAPAATVPAPDQACPPALGIAGWDLRRRAAEVVMVPAQETDVAAVATEVREGVGGILLFGSSAPIDLGAQLAALDAQAPGPPPIVATDEEGGGVQRMANLVGYLPWPRQMAAQWSPEQVQHHAAAVGRALRANGVTMDLAPVVDVDGGPGPDAGHADGLRSFSPDPRVASAYGLAFARGLLDGGVVPVMKHFPGHGHAFPSTDTAPATTPPLAQLRQADLIPFTTGIDAGLPAVMVGGLTVPGLTTGPADLSPAADTGLLQQLGFGGLVMTDSLSQGAVSATGADVPTAAEQAIEAGADLVEYGSDADTPAVIARLVTAVEAGRLPESRLDSAVARVLAVTHPDSCR